MKEGFDEIGILLIDLKKRVYGKEKLVCLNM
jgi:hypothetical protein